MCEYGRIQLTLPVHLTFHIAFACLCDEAQSKSNIMLLHVYVLRSVCSNAFSTEVTHSPYSARL